MDFGPKTCVLSFLSSRRCGTRQHALRAMRNFASTIMHGVAFLSPFKTGNLSAHYDHPALSRSRRHRERDFGMSVLTESRQIRLRLPNVGQRLQFGSDRRACVTQQLRVNCSYSCAVRKCTRTSASSAVGFRTVSAGGALPCARPPVWKFLSSATR